MEAKGKTAVSDIVDLAIGHLNPHESTKSSNSCFHNYQN